MTFYISWTDAVTAELQGNSQKGSSHLLKVRVTHTAQIGLKTYCLFLWFWVSQNDYN